MFADAESAKRYLVSQIVAQAKRDDVTLSETEEKILYFSETDWTLPDIWEVHADFERDYDMEQFESKIVELIRSFRAYANKERPAELASWKAAVRVLRRGDHYLLVMVNHAALPSNAATPFYKLVLWGIGVTIIYAVCCWLYPRL